MSTPTVDIPGDVLAEFCRRWKITEFSLFGSAARGEATSSSDVDVLVQFAAEAPWSTFHLVHMQDELRRLIGRDVDLVEESAIRNPFRRRSILRDKRVLYAA